MTCKKRPNRVLCSRAWRDCGAAKAVGSIAARGKNPDRMRALPAVLIALLLPIAAPARAELSPKAVEYLRQIGVDPDSAKVKAVADDVVADRQGKPVSLDELARHRNAAAVHRFIATRTFLRAYQADPATRIPSADDYEAWYLTPAEKAIVRPAFRRAGDELYRNSLKQKP